MRSIASHCDAMPRNAIVPLPESRLKSGYPFFFGMAHKPLKAKTEFIRMPIPNISEIKKPPFLTDGIPVEGTPQDMQTYDRSRN